IELLRRIRNVGYKGPVATVAADNSDRFQADALAAGADAFLGKPCGRRGFSQMVEQLLTFDAALGPDIAALASLCDHLKGAGGSYGLAPLTQVSRLALGQLQQSDPDAAAIQ